MCTVLILAFALCRSSDRVWYAWGVALRTKKQQEQSSARDRPYWQRKFVGASSKCCCVSYSNHIPPRRIKLKAGFIRVGYLKDITGDKATVRMLRELSDCPLECLPNPRAHTRKLPTIGSFCLSPVVSLSCRPGRR